MKRLWANTLGLALVWQSSGPLAAEPPQPANLGITLGRPQPLAEAVTIGSPGIQLTSYQAPVVNPVKPVSFPPEAGSSSFAAGSVWGTPPQRLTSVPSQGLAADGTPARPIGSGTIAASSEPPSVPTTQAAEPGFSNGVLLPSPVGSYDDAGCCAWDTGWNSGTCCYASADYLLWWIKSGTTPALVTMGPITSAGILGAAGTTVLFGGTGTTAQDAFAGGRFTVGFWCDPAQEHAIESTYFFLGQESTRFSSGPPGVLVLARPFFSLNTLTPFSKIIAAPGVSTGAVAIDAPSSLWGTELNWRCNLCRGEASRLDLLTGMRYLELDEGLLIADSVTPLAGGTIATMDSFETFNRFLGGQLGLQWECRGSRWSFDVRTKVALGGTQRSVTIAGSQFGGGLLVPGGLLALASNSGRFQQERVAIVPEVGLNIGYQCTDNLRFTFGYTLIYWNNVLRPGDQIDPVLDTSLIPNTPQPGVPPSTRTRPAVPLKATDFFAQGMNFGLEYRY